MTEIYDTLEEFISAAKEALRDLPKAEPNSTESETSPQLTEPQLAPCD